MQENQLKKSKVSESVTFFCRKGSVAADESTLSLLKEVALKDPLRRSRLCLHDNHDDRVQEMLIAVCRDSYIPPHRQKNKQKSYKVIRGEFAVVFFDDKGEIVQKIEMGEEKRGKIFLYRFSSNRWHTVMPLSEIIFYVETISGPFIQGGTEFADWSPKRNAGEQNKQFSKT